MLITKKERIYNKFFDIVNLEEISFFVNLIIKGIKYKVTKEEIIIILLAILNFSK
jgi:hypothetical protein